MESQEIRFTVKMKTLYMFEFLYINSYSGLRGIINYAFSLVGIIALIFGFGDTPLSFAALLILSLLFTVIDPLLLLFKAFRQVKTNKVFKEPIEYTFRIDGFSAKQNEESTDAPWDIVLLGKETLKSIILFTGNNNAIILPKADIGGQLKAFKELLVLVRPNECAKLMEKKKK